MEEKMKQLSLDQEPKMENDLGKKKTWNPREKNSYEESIKNPEEFWKDRANECIEWIEPFDKVKEGDMKSDNIQWFIGGKLNVTSNCVDRHAKKYPDRVAMIWEKMPIGTDEVQNDAAEKITYRQLRGKVCQLANVLKAKNIKKGDRVIIYMPMMPMAVYAILACSRIGAVHSVVFSDYSSEELSARINHADAKIVITVDECADKTSLKSRVDKALQSCKCVSRVLVATRTGANVSMQKDRDENLDDLMRKQFEDCTPEPLDSEDPLFILYTSGSAAEPKGVVHTQAGYLLYTGLTHELVFDHKEGDVFACIADLGWITCHSYAIYGPLCNGGTTVLFESSPEKKDFDRCLKMVERHRVTQIYMATNKLRQLSKDNDFNVEKYDRSSLRILGCVGEPIYNDTWSWYHDKMGEGKCQVVDTWWQTETGGIMIAPCPSIDDSEPKPGFIMKPFFGIDPVLINQSDEKIFNDTEGVLCIRQPWPSMARFIHGNPEKNFMESYCKQSGYKDLYFTGDGAYRDEKGNYQITGRMDDFIKVKGNKKVGTAQLENDMISVHQCVAEAALVPYTKETTENDAVFLFVTTQNEADVPCDLSDRLKDKLDEIIEDVTVPKEFLVVKNLPKTASGKIMRRSLRKIAEIFKEPLAKPEIIREITDTWIQTNKHKQQ